MSRGLRRTGFTLLEVVLALGLTVVVMSAIGVAIFLHLRAVDHTRVAVERDQLARVLMRRIGDDLRAAVRREPFDDSGLQALMGSAQQAGKALANAAGGGDSSGGSGAGGSGTGGTGTTSGAGTAGTAGTAQSVSSSDDSAAEDEAAAGTPAAIAGLYGTAYELQIDVARVPRPDEFAEALLSGAPPPSDVKTVYYFVANPAIGISPTGESGLMRSETNRATALFASENGDTDIFLQTAVLLAPEVMTLEFRYFDGLEWWPEWNSQEMNGLPLAVEVGLVLVDPRSENGAAAGVSLFDPSLSNVDPEQMYRTIVHLPNGQIAAATTGTTDSSSDEGVTDLGSTGGSSTGGSSTGGGTSGM